MTRNRIDLDFGGYHLISAFYQGKFQGRALLNNKRIFETDGDSIDDVLSKLKNIVTQSQKNRIVSGAPSPAADAFIEAFQNVMNRINDGQSAMIKAHYKANDQCLTPLELAKAAGYKDIGGVNLWYGFLGQWLFEQMTVSDDLLLNDDGSPVYTSVLAKYIENPSNPAGQKVWKLRPEVMVAIETLGLAN